MSEPNSVVLCVMCNTRHRIWDLCPDMKNNMKELQDPWMEIGRLLAELKIAHNENETLKIRLEGQIRLVDELNVVIKGIEMSGLVNSQLLNENNKLKKEIEHLIKMVDINREIGDEANNILKDIIAWAEEEVDDLNEFYEAISHKVKFTIDTKTGCIVNTEDSNE